MSVILEPTTDAKAAGTIPDIDLSRTAGPVTFEIITTSAGGMGAAEEFTLNTVNEDNSIEPIVEDTEPKKLTLANTVTTTYYKGVIRFTKTATTNPIGLRQRRFGG